VPQEDSPGRSGVFSFTKRDDQGEPATKKRKEMAQEASPGRSGVFFWTKRDDQGEFAKKKGEEMVQEASPGRFDFFSWTKRDDQGELAKKKGKEVPQEDSPRRLGGFSWTKPDAQRELAKKEGKEVAQKASPPQKDRGELEKEQGTQSKRDTTAKNDRLTDLIEFAFERLPNVEKEGEPEPDLLAKLISAAEQRLGLAKDAGSEPRRVSNLVVAAEQLLGLAEEPVSEPTRLQNLVFALEKQFGLRGEKSLSEHNRLETLVMALRKQLGFKDQVDSEPFRFSKLVKDVEKFLGFAEERVPFFTKGLNIKVEKFFRQIVSAVKLKGPELVKMAGAVFQINVISDNGPSGEIYLDLRNGIGSARRGTGKQADVNITVAEADFIAMSEGRLRGKQAWFEGKLQISGNPFLARRIGAVLDAIRNAGGKSSG